MRSRGLVLSPTNSIRKKLKHHWNAGARDHVQPPLYHTYTMLVLTTKSSWKKGKCSVSENSCRQSICRFKSHLRHISLNFFSTHPIACYMPKTGLLHAKTRVVTASILRLFQGCNKVILPLLQHCKTRL